MSTDLGIWVAALLTLAIYSFLYKDNPFYKIAEHLYVGVSTGYLMVVTVRDALHRDIWQPLFVYPRKEYIVLIPAFLGLLMFTRFTKKWGWLSRISITFIIGAAAGLAIPYNIQTYILRQTEATITPWGAFDGWVPLINNLLLLVGVLSVLVYFFFSVRHEGVVKPISQTGMFYLMLFFGASFGYTVMGRVSLLIGRMRYLLVDWLGLGG